MCLGLCSRGVRWCCTAAAARVLPLQRARHASVAQAQLPALLLLLLLTVQLTAVLPTQQYATGWALALNPALASLPSTAAAGAVPSSGVQTSSAAASELETHEWELGAAGAPKVDSAAGSLPSLLRLAAQRDDHAGHSATGAADWSSHYIGAQSLGVTYCALQGVLQNTSDPFNSTLSKSSSQQHGEGLRGRDARAAQCRHLRALGLQGSPALLHLFLRLVVHDGWAYVRGFAMMEDLGRHQVSFHFLSQSLKDHLWSHRLWLSSHRTGHRYGPLTLSSAAWAVEHKILILGEEVLRVHYQPLRLLPPDAVAPEFEVSTEAFGYTCHLLPSDDAPLDTLLSKSPQLAAKLRSRQEARGAVLPADPAGEAAALAAALEAKGPLPEPPPPPPAVPVLFLMSPFFFLRPAWAAKMLAWHMAWHLKYGVDAYVLYTQYDMVGLLKEPLLQERVQAGQLVVVKWDLTPILASHVFTGEQRVTCLENIGYWNQLLMYNHFMVSMWLEDVVVAVADVDEFLMTPKPTTIAEMLETATTPVKRHRLGFLELVRQVGRCIGCEGELEVETWAATDLDVPPGQHPIHKYVLRGTDDKRKPKSIYRPALVLAVDPHKGWLVDGAAMKRLSYRTQAYWLHLTTLNRERRYWFGNDGVPADEICGDLLWPIYASAADAPKFQGCMRSPRPLGNGTGAGGASTAQAGAAAAAAAALTGTQHISGASANKP